MLVKILLDILLGDTFFGDKPGHTRTDNNQGIEFTPIQSDVGPGAPCFRR